MSAFSDTFSKARQSESPSTYMVQDRQNRDELLRLTIQDHMFNTAMGGVLAEQEEPARFKKVLDVGCGTGSWVIEAARIYPTMSLVGIDISQSMIDYANTQAQAQEVAKRVTFQRLDALVLPGIADRSFDLINLRFGISYLRLWDWPQVMREMVRVARPGGIIRLTDAEIIHPGNSVALQKLCEMFLLALYRSHHLSAQDPTGIIPYLPTFLAQQHCQDIQTRPYVLHYRAGTTTGEAFYQDAMYIFRTIRPFLHKWGAMTPDYDDLYQQMLTDIKQPGFCARINFSTVWGRTSSK